MRYNYAKLIREVRSSVNSHYDFLAATLPQENIPQEQHLRDLIALEVSKTRDYSLIDDFCTLLARFFPELAPAFRLQELPRP